MARKFLCHQVEKSITAALSLLPPTPQSYIHRAELIPARSTSTPHLDWSNPPSAPLPPYTASVSATMSGYQLSEPPAYLSAASANALISDIQPTTIHPQTLQHINIFLDEILYSLLDAAQSLNPAVLRSTGVPAVFSADKASESTAIRSLGRSAIGEAELELRSWVEANGSLREGFGRDGKGNGMKRGPFVLQKAYEVMRGRCEEFSTLAGEDGPRDSMEGQRMAAWVACGGNGEDIVLSPAALYATAILEHVCEHVLAALARVVGRDSDNTSASLEDLFTAIAEDDGIWGFFKRMQVRVSLEEAIKARQKRAHPSRPTDRSVSRASPAPHSGSQTSLIQSSSSGAIRDQADSTKKSSLPPSSYDQARASHDTSRSTTAGGISSSASKSPPMGSSARFGGGIAGGPNREAHVRSPSVLSASTRNMIGAYNDQAESGSQFGRSRRDEEDDFDALVASGETMKVSLTPSRLKGFDGGRKQSPNASQAAYQRRDRPSGASPPRQEELPPLLPRTQTPSQTSGAGNTPPRPPRSSSMRSRGGSGTAPSAPSGPPKLLPRSASIVAEQDDSEDLADELDSPFKQRKGGRANKESLAELLASTGPAPEPAFSFDDGKEKKRTVPAVIVGTAPPRYDDQPPAESRSGETAPGTRGSVNRPGRVVDNADTDDLGSGKKKTPAREMADFFNDGPPSSGRTPPSNSTALPSSGGGKPKTSAQEMADFFNSYPAPPPATPAQGARFGAPVENLAPAPAKKGFKGFMSKIGGGGGGTKRKGSTDQTADDMIPTAGGPSWAGTKGYQAQVKAQGLEGGRKKSFASTATATPAPGVNYAEGGTRASSIADAYRSQQQQAPRLEPALPPLPPSSSAEQQSSPVSPQTSALPTPIAQKRLSQTSLSGSTKGAGGLSRKISTRKPVPYADSGVSPETPSSPTLAHPPPSFSPTLPSSPPMTMSPSGRGAPRKPSTVDEDVGSDIMPDQPVPVEEASAVGGRERSLREEKSTDQMSFATAREQPSGSATPADEAATPRVVNGMVVADPLGGGGVDSVPEAEDVRAGRDIEATPRADEAMDTVPEATAIRDEAKSDLLAAEGQAEPEKNLTPISEDTQPKAPSIPLTDLVPLRHLLDSATSVKECQMVLSAILTQWGVPQAKGEEGRGEDPESRIAAWLLAGRDGPVGDFAKIGGHEKGESSEATAVTSSGEATQKGEIGVEGEGEGMTLGGVVLDIKNAAVEGLQGVAKVF